MACERLGSVVPLMERALSRREVVRAELSTDHAAYREMIGLRTVRTGFGSSSETRNSLRPLSTTTKRKRYNMAIKLNHLIVPAQDKHASAQLFA